MGVDAVKIIRAHGMADQVVISSFNPFALRQAKRAGPEIECALLLAHDLPGWMRWGFTRRYSRADGLHPDSDMVDADLHGSGAEARYARACLDGR